MVTSHQLHWQILTLFVLLFLCGMFIENFREKPPATPVLDVIAAVILTAVIFGILRGAGAFSLIF